jgi:enamine deaminase RidA (YjgF/YER057c/UK114 family)
MSNADQLRDANPWHPITDAVDLKHLGKFAEELSECAAAAAIIFVDGGVARDPLSGKTNREGLEDEIADVIANIELVIERFALRREWIAFASSMFARTEAARWHVGRLAASASQCATAVARCIIQGIDECEPVTGRCNRLWLEDAVAHVAANIDLAVERFGFDLTRIAIRAERKRSHLKQWHALA